MNRTFSSLRRGFTLIELIVVISIIAMVAVFVVPAASTIILGTDLTRGSQILTGQLAMARQQAVTRQHPIEVRFIRFPDPEQPNETKDDSDTWNFRAIALMEILENGNPVLLTKLERFPGSVTLNPDKFSSLLDETGEAEPNQKKAKVIEARETDPPLPRMPKEDATEYEYVAFRFLPDGSTNLEARGKWYVTLLTQADSVRLRARGNNAEAIKQTNYFTVQVDPASGATRVYRPTVGS